MKTLTFPFFSLLSVFLAAGFVLAGEYSPTSTDVPIPQAALNESNWTLAAGEGVDAKMEFLPNGEGEYTKPCIHVTAAGENGLNVLCRQRIPAAEKGKIMFFKGWMRFADGVGRLNLTAFKDGKPVKISTWGCGNGMSYESTVWTQFILKIPSDGQFDEVRLDYTARPVTSGMVEHMSDPKGGPISEERAKLVTNRLDFCAGEPTLEVGEPQDPASCPKVEGYFTRRIDEKMTRELIALPQVKEKEGWYLTWRLFKTDAKDAGFDLYRREKATDGQNAGEWVKLNAEPLTKTTDFQDLTAKKDGSCEWKLVEPGGAETLARVANFDHGISIKLRDPEAKVTQMAIADLDGDGRYDYVVLFNKTGWVDPYYYYWRPSLGTLTLEAYDADGKFLWGRDLGPGIETGVWYSPFICADLDGDGKAEVAVKTADDRFASGELQKNATGRVDCGKEYVAVWDGMTGEELARAEWPSRRGLTYNYYCRNMLSVAYLDGKTPILLALRGTYTLQTMFGWQFREKTLERKFFWTNAFEPYELWGRGAHTLHSTDVDGDGRDEIAVGTFILDDTGATLWAKGLHHPDHLYIGEIQPDHPGMEVYWGVEGQVDGGGMGVLDAKTGEWLWKFNETTYHIHAQGLCADIDPKYPGCECYGGEEKNPHSFYRYLWSADGQLLQKAISPAKLRETKPDLNVDRDFSRHDIGGWDLGYPTAYWDADPQKEIIMNHFGKPYSYGRDEFCEPYFRFNAGSIVKVCDVVGDWREELFVTAPGELRIYTTKIPAETRRPTLMQDRNYRASITEASMGYGQSPLLGEGL